MLSPIVSSIFQVPAVPFTAWEQAVFVVLLIVMVVIVLRWQARENKSARDFQASISRFMSDQQSKRDNDWRQWMEDQKQLDNQRLEAVQTALEALAALVKSVDQNITEHRAEFVAHDQKEWARLDEMSARLRGRRLKGGDSAQ